MNALIYMVMVSAVTIAVGEPKADAGVKFDTTGFITGNVTEIENPLFSLVQDDAGWTELWQAHKGPRTVNGLVVQIQDPEPQPKIDFEKNMVIAYFAGQSPNVTGYEVAGIEKAKNSVTLKLRATFLPSSSTVLTTPFAMIQTTRYKGTINVQVSSDGEHYRSVGALKLKS